MASSFAEKILKATALKEKGPESSSRTRKYSASGSTSKMGSSSSSKYGSKSPLPDSVIPLPTTRLPASVPSTRRRSSNDFTSSTGTLSSRSSRFTEGPTNANKRGRIRRSVGELESMLSRPCAIREGTRSQESPYGKKLPYERSPKRKSSFADSLKDLSNAFSSPVASPSPQVSTLGSSPRLDYGDIPGISASPLVDDDQIFQSEHQDPGGSRDKGTSQSGNGQELEPQQLGEVGTSNAATSDPPTSTLQPPRVNVGRAFTSLLPETPPLMTNPLYPTISSPEYSPSPPPPSAAHIDGFDIPAFGINLPNAPGDVSPMSKEEEIFPVEPVAAFLQKRKAAAATQRQKGPGTGDPNSAASQAILKRRTQVLSTVQKAKARLSVLTYEGTKKRRSFKNNCFGRFRRWLYERERKRMVGKGTVVNKLWLDSLKMMEVRYGSPMMVAFGFIRWVFLLNAFLAVLWLCFIVIPFLAHPPKTFSWKVFWGTLRDKKLVKETFQGSNLEKTFVYYGGYTYTRSEQRGWYRVDYFYAVMIAATFLFSFICVLVRIAGTIMRSGDVGVAVRLYPFSTLVFSSWDFHLINTDAASKLRRGIRMRLKEMVADARDLEKTVGLRDRLMSAKRATALFILWPMLMAANVAIVVELVMKAEQFLFSLANEGKEPPAGGQGRSSSVLQTTRRRSNQVKHRLRRPSFSHEEKSRRAPGASRQRASAICTLLDMVCVMSGAPRSRSEGTSGISLSADNSSKSASEDKARVPVALIRGLKLPSDAKVAPSAPSIWSILTPLSGSFLWGSLSSEEASTSRSLVSLPRPGGGSDAMSTARTSLSSPPESPVRASLSAAASAVNKLLRAASEGPECRPSPPPTSPLELLHAATPLSTHHRTVSCSPVQCGVMPIASTPTVSRSSVSVPGGTRADQSSERSSSVSGSSTQERYRRSTGGGVSVSWWGRIIGRPKRESASKRLSRMTARSGARISSQRSGFPSPVMSAIGVQQWLARAVEGSRSGSENLTTPREASV